MRDTILPGLPHDVRRADSGATNPRRPGSRTRTRGGEPSRVSGDIGTKSPWDAPRPGMKSSEDEGRGR
eukprot:1036494-Alexandrium_andersonii.AAC.1